MAATRTDLYPANSAHTSYQLPSDAAVGRQPHVIVRLCGALEDEGVGWYGDLLVGCVGDSDGSSEQLHLHSGAGGPAGIASLEVEGESLGEESGKERKEREAEEPHCDERGHGSRSDVWVLRVCSVGAMENEAAIPPLD